MRLRRATLILLGLIAGAFYGGTLQAANSLSNSAHGGHYPVYPPIQVSAAAAAAVRRGEYEVRLGDCISCHTAEGGKPFAGGLPIETEFGTLYTPNITPDPKTGIGGWTLREFTRALRQGIAPDGSYYFPVFPYVYFNKLTDKDVQDIFAYLQHIPPVHKKDRPVDMPIPFRWRWLQFFWRLLYFKPYAGVYRPDPHESAQWNRGRYIVTGLGHCAMCHTPLNRLGAPERMYNLTGAFVEGFYAPNITSTHLDDYTKKEIVHVFLNYKLLGGGSVEGPMREVDHESLRHLTKSDLKAIAVYLRSVKSETPPHPVRTTKVSLTRGSQIYHQYCMACHAAGLAGAPRFGNDADWAPRIKEGLNTLYEHAIDGFKRMPPMGTCSKCSRADIESAVDYMVAHSGGKVPEHE